MLGKINKDKDLKALIYMDNSKKEMEVHTNNKEVLEDIKDKYKDKITKDTNECVGVNAVTRNEKQQVIASTMSHYNKPELDIQFKGIYKVIIAVIASIAAIGVFILL